LFLRFRVVGTVSAAPCTKLGDTTATFGSVHARVCADNQTGVCCTNIKSRKEPPVYTMKSKTAAEKTQPVCTMKRKAAAVKTQPANTKFPMIVAFAGKGITVHVSPDQTIDTVRKRVSRQIGVDCTRLQTWNGLPLPGRRTVGECDITVDDVLIMHHGMQISIKFMGDSTFTLDVEPHEHIEAIKAKIQDMKDIHPSRQHLRFNLTSLHEGPLSGYNIQHGSLLHASRIVQVFVETPEGPELSLEVNEIDTISKLMQQISDSYGIICTELWDDDDKQLHLTPSRRIRTCKIGEGTHLRSA
jgi:hypothetical protein